MHIHSIANFNFREDKLDEVITELKRLMKVTAEEKGCIEYFYVQNLNVPSQITSYEIWETMEDLERHVKVVQDSKNKIFFEYLTEVPFITNFSKI